MNDQLILDIIFSSLSTTFASPAFDSRLQCLKKHLYNRSFAEAFPTSDTSISDNVNGNDQSELLETYVLRWVPTRALCYGRVIEKIAGFLPTGELRIVSIGAGCGSETLAFQAALSRQSKYSHGFSDH